MVGCRWNGQAQLPGAPSRTTVQTVHDATSLALGRVERSDAGTYTLLLENCAGKATFSVKLKVVGQSVTNTHTHTHPFNGPFSGTTQVGRYQKGKTNLDLLKQETVSGSGIRWAI